MATPETGPADTGVAVRRVLVTGSGAWTNAWQLKQVLDDIVVEAASVGTRRLTLVHGACYPDKVDGRVPARSADWLAHLWIDRFGHAIEVVEEAYPAPWGGPCVFDGPVPCPPPLPDGSHRKRRADAGGPGYCPAAGVRRNQVMVDTLDPGRDHAVAFQFHNSTGTADCMARLARAGFTVAAGNFTPIIMRRI